jgi:hypothetical protein
MPLRDTEKDDSAYGHIFVYTVRNSQRIDSFLAKELNLSLSKIKILLSCSGVEMVKPGKPSFLKDGGAMVHPGDEIMIDDPLPDVCKCLSSLDPSVDFYDYVLIPSGYPVIAQYFEYRPHTIELTANSYDLLSFIDALNDPTKIVDPISDLIIVGHGSPKGSLKLPLSPGSKSNEIEYPDLKEATSTEVLFIKEKLLWPRPPSTGCAPTTLHIKSCNIGKSVKFMEEFKKAIGGKITVTAPKYFDQYWSVPGLGCIGYMDYSFSLAVPPIQKDLTHNSPKFALPYNNRDAVIKAFVDKGFKLYNDEPVPRKYWQQWFRQDAWNQTLKWNEKFLLNVTKNTLVLPVEFRCNLVTYAGSFFADKPVKSYEERKQALSDELENNQKSFSGDYPEYEWYDYGSMEEFMDGWEWIFKLGAKSEDQWKVSYSGYRYEYMVKRPIVDPPNTLIVNFYPNKTAAKKFAQVTMLEPKSPLFNKFFTVV